MKKTAFLGLLFASVVGWAQTDTALKAVADQYDEKLMYFDYFLHSYDQHIQSMQERETDFQTLQTLDASVQQTSLWKNLNFFLKAKIAQEKACKPYYWMNDAIYGLSGAFDVQRGLQGAEAPKTIDEFNKMFDEGLVEVQAQLQYAHEKLLRIQTDGVILPRSALDAYMNMIDRPESSYQGRLGLTYSVEQLPSLTECPICQQIDGQLLIQKYDAAIAPLMADIATEFDKVMASASATTSLIVPETLRVDCYKSVLTGIYSDLTGPMVLKKGESELLRAEKSMLEILMKLGKPLTPPLSISAFIEQVYKEMAADPKNHLKTEADYQKIYDSLLQRYENKKDLITSLPLNYPLKYNYALEDGFPKSGGYYFNGDEEAGYFNTVSGLAPGYLSFEIAYLFIHEGVPGHHLEQSLNHDFQKTADNSFDKMKDFFPFVEGWGLYTEELAFDLDLYQNLEEQFTFFDALRLRALRMINAYRFYFDGWDDSKVIAFTDEHLFGDEKDATDAVGRAKRWDAQGVGYMTGKTILISMKNSAHKILGSGCFTLAEYHDSFFKKGSAQLDTLVWQTAQWIKENKCYRGELSERDIEVLLRKDILDAFTI